MIGALGPWEPEAYSAAVDMDSTRLRGGIEEAVDNNPQRPKALLLLLARFCRWSEASAFAHCAGFS